MSFRLRWTPQATAAFAQLQQAAEQASRPQANLDSRTKGKAGTKPSKQQGLFKHVAKTLQLLQQNPRHPGLNTHEYVSLEHPYDRSAKVSEAYVQNRTPGAYRIFWCYGPEHRHITVIAITPHP